MKTQTAARPFEPGRHEQRYAERVPDAYMLRQKLQEPTVCPRCGAVYHLGRWQWAPRPQNADEVLCAACHRIADRNPAGYVHIEGRFATEHRDELLQLLRNREERACSQRPMERIMAIEVDGDQTIVTTTDVHLARDLGVALKSAFQGELSLKFSKDENLLRAYWAR